MPADPYREIRAALRRELDRKRLRDGIWKDLVHWGFAEQVLRGSRTIEWLANAYRIKEEDYHPQRRARPHREPPADRRAQALAQIVAFRLDWLLPAMALFRERHLEGGHLSVEEMAGWITGQAAAEGPPLDGCPSRTGRRLRRVSSGHQAGATRLVSGVSGSRAASAC